MWHALHRWLWLSVIGRIITKPFIKLTIFGRENIPANGDGGLLIIANHFSWFEAPIILTHLPLRIHFMVATELQRNWLLRQGVRATEAIPVWRGTVDRTALKTAIAYLNNNEAVALFPEGGIDPALQEQVKSGSQITTLEGHTSRASGELITVRPGAAYLAIASQARILPVAVRGGENVTLTLANLWRRTPVTMHIGPAFGPLELPPGTRGAAKRDAMNALGDEMMGHLAQLFPPEKRGPYG